MTSTYKKQVLVSLGPVSRFGLATTWEDMLFPRIQQISVKYVLVQEIFFTKYLNCQLSVHDLSPPSLWPNALERERLVVETFPLYPRQFRFASHMTGADLTWDQPLTGSRFRFRWEVV